MYIVSEDLLRALYKLCCSRFFVSSDQRIKHCRKDFTRNYERDFYVKMIVTIIPTNLVTNSLLPFFVLS